MGRKAKLKAARRQNRAIVDMGQVLLSEGASAYLDRYRVKAEDLLARFRAGDWGDNGKFAEVEQNLTEEEREIGVWATSDDSKVNAASVLKGSGAVLGIYSLDPINDSEPVWIYCKIKRHTYVMLPSEHGTKFRVTDVFLS